jgi:hypothetical protein
MVHSKLHASEHRDGGDDEMVHRFDQASALATWVIVHNLGYRPNVHVEDSTGDTWIGDIHHDSDNQLTLTFSAAFAGTAWLS